MKSTTFFIICSMLISIFSFGQTSTELFETESSESTSFTDNGVIFNIISHVSNFDIINRAATGWNGPSTSIDNRYIDNTGSVGPEFASFSIRTTSNLFKVNRFWVYVSNQYSNQNVTGSLTITGKLSGVTKFSRTKSSNFNTSISTTNGYTLIDLTNLDGQNYSNIIIDQLQLTLGGNFYYIALDSFTWVKDSNIVLGTSESKLSSKSLNVYPNPTKGPLSIKAEKNSEAKIYSVEGKTLKTVQLQKGSNDTNISDLPKGVYFIRTANESTKVIKD